MTGKNLIQKLSKTKLTNSFTKELVGFILVKEYNKPNNSNERLAELATLAYMLDVPQLNFFIKKIKNFNIKSI